MTISRSAKFENLSTGIPGAAYFLIGAWILAMITVPILRWVMGDATISFAVILTTLLQCGAVFYLLQQQWGFQHSVKVLVLVALLAWTAEALGSKTSFPFGAYHYTDLIQPQILGVPLLIPIAWFMMLPSSWAVAQTFTSHISDSRLRRISFVAVSALSLTAWDLFLDPQMVKWGLWVWAEPSGYFGIPWQNFAGWILVAAIITACVNPIRLRVFPFLLIYAIVWILQTIGLSIFWNLPGPGLVGFLVMGGFALLSIHRIWRDSRS